MEKIKRFFKEVVKEMKLVHWPNKHDIKEGTIVVIVMSAIVGLFLAGIDTIFDLIVNWII